MVKNALDVLIRGAAVFLFAALGLSAPQAPTSDSGAAVAATSSSLTGVVATASASPAGAQVTSGTGAISQGPQAVVLRLIRFSGQARDVAGKPLAGVAEITFSLYEEQAGGEALWFETQTLPLDEQGRYTALLGAMHTDGLPLDLFISGRAHWLGMQVGKLPEQPRALLVSVPYALKAADAETLGGKPASAFMPAQPEAGKGEAAGSAVGQGKAPPAGTRKAGTQAVTTTANYIPVFADSAGTLTNSGFYQDPVTGNIGLGTTNPELKLHVMGNILLGGGLSGPASTVLKVRAKWSSGRFGELSAGPFVASDSPGKSITFYTTPRSTGVLTEAMRITPDGFLASDVPGKSIAFLTTPSSTATPTEAMRITSDGKVGIGTTSPSYRLQVSNTNNPQDSQPDAVITNNGIEASLLISPSNNPGGADFALVSGGTGSIIVGQGKFGIVDRSSATSILTVGAASKYVGIGTTSPLARLEVNGGVRLNNTDQTKPPCTPGSDGTFWVTKGGAGIKDLVEVCAKDAADSYAWRTLY